MGVILHGEAAAQKSGNKIYYNMPTPSQFDFTDLIKIRFVVNTHFVLFFYKQNNYILIKLFLKCEYIKIWIVYKSQTYKSELKCRYIYSYESWSWKKEIEFLCEGNLDKVSDSGWPSLSHIPKVGVICGLFKNSTLFLNQI